MHNSPCLERKVALESEVCVCLTFENVTVSLKGLLSRSYKAFVQIDGIFIWCLVLQPRYTVVYEINVYGRIYNFYGGLLVYEEIRVNAEIWNKIFIKHFCTMKLQNILNGMKLKGLN